MVQDFFDMGGGVQKLCLPDQENTFSVKMFNKNHK